jgi:hypothetical protein
MCLTGEFVPQLLADCQVAKFDLDDASIFLQCYSGAETPADPNCANG